MNSKKTVCGLGELLWDLLPSGARLGGAPANFAVMAARLGNHGVIASRLGSDALGDRARSVLSAFPVDLSSLQQDAEHSTGAVDVMFAGNEPHYAIRQPAAWDFLAWTNAWQELAAHVDAVCFGTLAQRGEVARATIRHFLAATRAECVRVFDVNLRTPFYSAKSVAESLSVATIFKLNEAEMPLVLQMLEGPTFRDLPNAAKWLLEQFPMQLVAVTLDAHGSLLVTRDASHRHPGVSGKVVDTVGAGDAFTAALLDAFLRGTSLAAMNEAANRWGAWVASQPGAIPDLDANMPAFSPRR